MPTIPQYNATRNITSTQSAPFRNEVDQNFANQQKIIGTMADIAQKWSDANDVMQYTDAKAKYETSAMDVQTRAYQDQDFNNAPKYIKELEDVKKNSLAGISNKQVAYKLGAEIDHSNRLTGIRIYADAGKKQLEFNRFQFGTNLDILQSKKISSLTDAERQDYDRQINELVNSQVNSGIITKEEALKSIYESSKRSIEDILYINPDDGLRAIEKDNVLSEKDKYKLTQQARTIKKNNQDYADWQTQQIQVENTILLSEAVQNKTLTPGMVREMQQSGKIDTETASVYTALALEREYPAPTESSLVEPDYFLSLLEESRGDKVQIKKILADAAIAYNKHKIGTNQYQYFIQNAKEIFDNQSKGIFTTSSERQGVMGALYSIRDFFKGIGADKRDESKAYDKFFDRYKAGEDSALIKESIQKEYVIERNPSILNLSSDGEEVMDDNGNIRIMNNKLEIKQVKTATEPKVSK